MSTESVSRSGNAIKVDASLGGGSSTFTLPVEKVTADGSFTLLPSTGVLATSDGWLFLTALLLGYFNDASTMVAVLST